MLKARVLFVLLLAVTLLAACADVSITGSGNVVTEEESISGFDKVDTSHGFKVAVSFRIPLGEVLFRRIVFAVLIPIDPRLDAPAMFGHPWTRGPFGLLVLGQFPPEMVANLM